MYDVALDMQRKNPNKCISPCVGCFHEVAFGKCGDVPLISNSFNPSPISFTIKRSYN